MSKAPANDDEDDCATVSIAADVLTEHIGSAAEDSSKYFNYLAENPQDLAELEDTEEQDSAAFVRRPSLAGSIDTSVPESTDSTAYRSDASGGMEPLPPLTRAVQNLGIPDDEEVEHQHPAWMECDVLIQGRLLLTRRALYFYANLPYYSSALLRATSLSIKESGLLGQHWSRYWFVLRQDSFAYFASAGESFFPLGTIDLTTALYAKTLDDEAGGKYFALITEEKTYGFKADSANSSHEWVKDLTKEIFRSRNKGPFVKVEIPIANIADILKSKLSIFNSIHLKVVKNVPDGHQIQPDLVQYDFLLFFDSERIIEDVKDHIRRYAPNNDFEWTDSKHLDLDHCQFGNLTQQIVDTTFHSGSATFRLKGSTHIEIQSLYSQLTLEGTPLSTAVTPDGSGTPTAVGTPTASPPLSRTNSKNSRGMVRRVVEDGKSVLGAVSRPDIFVADVLNSLTSSDAEMDDIKRTKITPDAFRRTFSFGDSTMLIDSFLCYFYRNSTSYFGRMFVSDEYLCFQRLSESQKLIPAADGNDKLVIIPWTEVEKVEQKAKHQAARLQYSRLAVITQLSNQLSFEFPNSKQSTACLETIRKAEALRKQKQYDLLGTYPTEEQVVNYTMRYARLATYEENVNRQLDIKIPPMIIDPIASDHREAFLSQPMEKLRITMLTIGSRGDVQPYIALAQSLMKEGHHCKIATHKEFKDFVEGYGIEFAEVGGDPKALMEIMIEYSTFSYAFIKEASNRFKGWITELLDTSWKACQDTDLLIESPSAMAGIHIAEALKVPYFRAFTMPWTRTRAYPHAFINPDANHTGRYNYMTYVIFENMVWLGIANQVNSWRKKTLGISKTNLEHLHQYEVPFLYCVSPYMLPPTVDQPDWIHITGYWEVDQDLKYKPPKNLSDFIELARKDGKPLVYIGFGSIVVSDPYKMSEAVAKGVQKAGVRCVLVKGWSERANKHEKQYKFPSDILMVDSVPHQWLFPKVDAAVHHGGSGTTGMSVRCGIPTIIKPFFGDQFFYSRRVEELGVGLRIPKLTAESLSRALKEATTNTSMIAKAKALGEVVGHERGVETAIATIYQELPYARSLIKGEPSKVPGISRFARRICDFKPEVERELAEVKEVKQIPKSLWTSIKGVTINSDQTNS